MYLRQAIAAASRHAARPSGSPAICPGARNAIHPYLQPVMAVRRSIFGWGKKKEEKKKESEENEQLWMVPFEEVRTHEDLLPPGAPEGTVPTDMNQATGLERLELLGKMQGVDVFDMRPLDSSRLGTLDDPIKVKSGGDEQYVGCTGCPADSHHVHWLTISRGMPLNRCTQCGSCYEMEYIGPPDDPHAHHDPHAWVEEKRIDAFIKPEYYWR